MSGSRKLSVFICLRPDGLVRLPMGYLVAVATYLRLRLRFTKPRFEDSAASIGGWFFSDL